MYIYPFHFDYAQPSNGNDHVGDIDLTALSLYWLLLRLLRNITQIQ